jgi:Dockerin type I domain
MLGPLPRAGLTIFFTGITAALLLTAPAAGAVTLYDLSTDFDLVTNTASSRWSYWTYPGTVTFDYQLLASVQAVPQDGVYNDVAPYDGWTSGEFAGYPYPNVGALIDGTIVAMHGGDMAVRPAIVSWLPPGDGRVSLEYAVTDLDPGPSCCPDDPECDGILWRLRVNATNALHGAGTQLDTGTECHGSSSGVRTMSGIDVLADHRINLRVHDGGGCLDHDVTGVVLRIWYTPAGQCEADITGARSAPDGNVDALDFLALIAQWGSTTCATAPCSADLTGPAGVPDGAVDALDFLLLIAQWSSPCP